jgi:hypothetical protein
VTAAVLTINGGAQSRRRVVVAFLCAICAMMSKERELDASSR